MSAFRSVFGAVIFAVVHADVYIWSSSDIFKKHISDAQVEDLIDDILKGASNPVLKDDRPKVHTILYTLTHPDKDEPLQSKVSGVQIPAAKFDLDSHLMSKDAVVFKSPHQTFETIPRHVFIQSSPAFSTTSLIEAFQKLQGADTTLVGLSSKSDVAISRRLAEASERGEEREHTEEKIKEKRAEDHKEKVVYKNPETIFTPGFMAGLLMTIVWVLVFSVGFCCLANLQTPNGFREKCLAINKEY